ncbi:Hachiman antiphage defense system protein HamA [Sphingomonas sp. TX0543]|uniref:Hachiman antiphage defense system protein HamA n=1 Tax=Sphingomonas sp. TX0543 TaxID=3399682 RepID=UPI003AFB3834
MAKIKDWCGRTDTKVKSHNLIYLEADPAKLHVGTAHLAAVVPGHYAAASRVAHILGRLGKVEAAEYVLKKLPTGPRSRSGDIGEILASSFVSEFTGYKMGVLKLRWKDHREMAMRGDDILAVRTDPTVTVRFLKGEVKSRASLGKKTVEEARKALLSSDNRPTPHALSFVADRLYETGDVATADLIDEYQLRKRIKLEQVSHMMFMFTGSDPSKLLTDDLQAYKGKVKQVAVGLRVKPHQSFIKGIFGKVIADGKKS